MNYGRKTPMFASLLALAALGGGMGHFDSPATPTAPKKHDPERPKTQADLDAIARAQQKRDRKAKRNAP